MSDSKVQPETSAECSLRDRYARALHDARCDQAHEWWACEKRGEDDELDAVLAVRDDVLAEKDAEIERLRECRAKHPTNPTVVPCVLDRDHEGDHASTTGCPGSVMHWPTAEAEVVRLRETVGRVEALCAELESKPYGEQLTSPLVIRAALAPRDRGTANPRRRAGWWAVMGEATRQGRMLRFPAADPAVSHLHMRAVARLLDAWEADAENDNYSKADAVADLRDALAAACTCRALPHGRTCPRRRIR